MGKLQRITPMDIPGLKICFWDLETTSLNASFGHLLCAGVKPAGVKTQVIRLDKQRTYRKERWNDRDVAVKTRDLLEEFHVAVTYNGFRFDVPFLNSRLLSHHERVLSQNVKHVDLYNVVRYRMRLSSGRLDALLAHLDTPDRKTPLEPELWRRAVGGDKEALEMIIVHNEQDCKSLEQAFNQLIPLFDIQFRLIR